MEVEVEVEVDVIGQDWHLFGIPTGPEVYDTSRNLRPSGVVAPSIEAASAIATRASMRRNLRIRIVSARLLVSSQNFRCLHGASRTPKAVPSRFRACRAKRERRSRSAPPPLCRRLIDRFRGCRVLYVR